METAEGLVMLAVAPLLNELAVRPALGEGEGAVRVDVGPPMPVLVRGADRAGVGAELDGCRTCAYDSLWR